VEAVGRTGMLTDWWDIDRQRIKIKTEYLTKNIKNIKIYKTKNIKIITNANSLSLAG
jgi:hypothetical protein